MVLNSSVVASVVNLSANVCQYIACNPERLPTDQVLNLLFCLPLHEFRRLAFSLWTYIFQRDADDDDDEENHSD